MRRELAPEFEVTRLLGQGRMSRVYLAEEKALRRLVAIKVLRQELAPDETARKRFDREARSGAKIRHPNVTAVYRVGALSDGLPYMVMEYVDGRTMGEELAATGPLDVGEARKVLLQVAKALAAAHHHRVVHRDLRPGNVLRERETDRVVLSDFGLAAVLERAGQEVTRLTRTGEILGDAQHVSPEVLRAEPVTEETDIYAFGVLGYELLTGDGPFPGLVGAQLATAHIHREPAKLSDIHPGVDRGLSDLLLHCLAKTPKHRPRASDIVRWLESPARTGPEGLALVPGSPGKGGALSGFLNELKERRVYRAAATYLAGAFVVLEGAQIIWDSLPFPAWAFDVLVWVTLAGFPLALLLAWAYDITRTGIRRAPSLRTESASAEHRTHVRALQAAGMALSLLAAVAFGWWFLGR